MFQNRIILANYVYHDDARIKIQQILDDKGITDQCINELHIFSDNGYIRYKVVLSDKTYFEVFDDGTIL